MRLIFAPQGKQYCGNISA